MIVAAVPPASVMEMEPVRVVSVLFEIESRLPFGLVALIPPSSCCCSKDRVGEPYSGSALPELSYPSCVFMALISEL